MLVEFSFLKFAIESDRIGMLGANTFSAHTLSDIRYSAFAEVSVAGEDKPKRYARKGIYSSECEKLRYVRHELDGDVLRVIQRSQLVEVESVFEKYADAQAVRVYSRVTNISNSKLTLEEVASLSLPNVVDKDSSEFSDLYFYEFIQSHHVECQVRRRSFFDYGLLRGTSEGQKSICFSNTGSWSTKERLPQAIVENTKTKEYLAFQIESNNAWHYELSDVYGEFYLWLSGASFSGSGWAKTLGAGESYQTATVAIARGNSLNDVLGELTKYRRHIKGVCLADQDLPTIYNEYMHLSWDSPNEENTREYAKTIAKLGLDYYVIDCGWHNEEPGKIIYPYVGQWKDSKARFPSGLKNTVEYIRSLGMKAGLWIEPEIIGKDCQEMLAYYDDDCFLQRNGKRVCVGGRYFLDFRNQKVRDYLTKTIEKMVEEYGAEYIKLDYNQDVGIGTDKYGMNAVYGLEDASNAYMIWLEGIKERFKNVLFETCSSGGMRMDYKMLSHFSIVSTSDQTRYFNYPYIAGNVLAAVLPEQSAVWSYPVDSFGTKENPFVATREWCEENVSKEQVIINMINSFLGRIHLASHLELLSEEKLALVKEGLEYYKTLTEVKKIALPYFPLGFTSFGDKTIASGLQTKDKIYLAVWNLNGEKEVKIPLDCPIVGAKLVYPADAKTQYFVDIDGLNVKFDYDVSARFFEIEKE